MRNLLAFCIFSLVIGWLGFSLIDGGDGDISSQVSMSASASESSFARAIDSWEWTFPEDHGAHPDFQTEWWYYTGNLVTSEGRRFGFQLTFFRRALTNRQIESEWRANQVYMAHFTISDIAGEQFFHDVRYSRNGANLAGALADAGGYRIWLEDWVVQGDDHQLTLSAQGAEGFAIALQLEQVKPPALHGDNGLSQKSADAGNASYYYSLSRLQSNGTMTIDGEKFVVSGNTWMDHEFSTSALGDAALGWDWFGLIFDDGSELMVGQIRLLDGSIEPAFGGLLIEGDGQVHYLSSEQFSIEPTGEWQSPHTGYVYPSGWQITLASGDNLTITPLMQDQELYGTGIIYWEGAVRVEGDRTGYGYAELTGYADAMTGRF